MAITMQGAWTISVKSKNASFPQRFLIQGSDSADGIYPGEPGSPAVNVTGAQWSITIQHNPNGPVSWLPSAERVTNPVLSGSQLTFDIQSNDSGGDHDYNDLVLSCATAANDSEFVLYGNVRTYEGFCFNPCFRFPWLVIDTAQHLRELLKYPAVSKVIEALYPERVKIIRRPFPEPDPAPFRPIMIPLNAFTEESGAIFENIQPNAPVAAATSMKSITAYARLSLSAGVFDRVSPHVRDLAKLLDRIRLHCSVKDQPGLLLRFLEYDRTADELAGGAYSGEGDRQVLGLTVTDEQGNYIFRFTRTLADIAEEVSDVPSGGVLANELRPDILVQVVNGTTVLFETGLHTNIPNLKRIDLCIPESVINPGPTACQGGRAIQAVGNIFTISGVGNTLDAEGRITATHSSGPQITRGAWAGRLDLFACFTDQPAVKYYTIRFRKPGSGWSFVQEEYKHVFIPFIGDPGHPAHKVGPFTRTLTIDGVTDPNAPAYNNIESDSQWLATHRLRKVKLSSSVYADQLYLTDHAGPVEFKIEGYDASGNKVAGAEDTITLYIDNRPVTGDIDTIALGAIAPGECGLFELPSANAALTIRFKADHPGGFTQRYYLDVRRGSNTAVAVSDTTTPVQPLDLVYNEATHGNFFFGTFNGVAPDSDNYVLAELQADSGAWLPSDKNFCAFAFELWGVRRATDGYHLNGAHRLDQELIGISFTPPAA